MERTKIIAVENYRSPHLCHLTYNQYFCQLNFKRMKKLLFATLLFLSIDYNDLKAQSSVNTLDVVSWNVEFFGAPFASGPTDKDLQEINVKKVLRWLNADLYGLVEVVDTMRLRRVVDSLGNTEYGFFVAPYCSGNTTGTGGAWTSGQKQAFIYRKSIFSNINVRGLMRNSSPAYTNWASGRFPYMFSATATINSVSKSVNFIVLHGKAGSTQADYDKRYAAATELKDTLDAQFSTENVYIIGDFNDALNASIYTGASVTSYDNIVKDSTDADHYKSITLPLGASGQTTMINFPNVIDNHIISNEVEPFYVPGSAKIKNDVTSIIPDYVTAHNTSDHYPVFSQYNLSGVVTGVTNVSANEMGVVVYPNPFKENIYIKATKTLTNVNMQLINLQGQVIHKKDYNLIPAGSFTNLNYPALQSGVYFLQMETRQYKTVVKLVVL